MDIKDINTDRVTPITPSPKAGRHAHAHRRVAGAGKRRLAADETPNSDNAPKPKGYDLSDIGWEQAIELLKVFPQDWTTPRGEDLRDALVHIRVRSKEPLTHGMKSALADASQIVQDAPKDVGKNAPDAIQKQMLSAHMQTAFQQFDQLALAYGKPPRRSLDVTSSSHSRSPNSLDVQS